MMRKMKLWSLLSLSVSLSLCSARAQNDDTCVDQATCSNNVQRQCGLFLAESSIPHSGWGMYTAKPLEKDEVIGPSDKIINVGDMKFHNKKSRLPNWLMNSYYWHPRFGGAHTEAREMDSIIPGLGMLANSHTGLVNSENLGSRVQEGPKSRYQPESGAYSYHSNLTFVTNQNMPAGMELFVEYGDSWFEERGDTFGYDLPLSHDFWVADDLLKQFMDGNPSQRDFEKWSSVTVKQQDERVQRALPKTFDDAQLIHQQLKGSTALFSVHPNVIRPLDWLYENGLCLDHIYIDASRIPQAGQGAFASRPLPEGTVVAPAPLVHFHKRHLEMWEQDIKYGNQLLLNYVYSHPSSSVVLFPYSPGVNVINHSQNPNVKVRWSSEMSHTGEEFLELSTRKLMEENEKAGLMLEFVALRDIKEGEEILVDYGPSWEAAWQHHVETWNPPRNARTYEPAHVFNAQNDIKPGPNAYPPNISTICWATDMERHGDTFQWSDTADVQTLMDFYRYTEDTHRCSVLSRQGDLYVVEVDWWGDMDEEEDEEEERARPKRIVTHVPRRAIAFVDEPYTADAYLRSAFRHYIQLPDEMVPPSWRDLETPSQCGLYMAESSIPNAGLGMFSGAEKHPGDPLFYSDLVIQVEDFEENNKLRHWFHMTDKDSEPMWLLDSYYWNPENTASEFEATDVQSIVPGLGMLANSHMGLVNAEIERPYVRRTLDRLKDPGAGGSTNYHDISHTASTLIPVGMELFVSYGDHWFLGRTEDLGVLPVSRDFEMADHLIKSFWGLVREDTTSDFAKDLWDLVWFNATASENRVRMALPKNLSDVERVVETGTAIESVPDAVRSMEWLQANGLCLDHIRPGKSDLPQAGMGAFATRFLAGGSVIAPAPMVHIHRKHLEIWDSDDMEDETKVPFQIGQQQLLNYCYGHHQSGILLFPYSPVTNYINHHYTDFNAELRWSSIRNHKQDWLDRSVGDLMEEDHAGLIMEIVATRDIQEGEEILLNYGKQWQEAWDAHVAHWKAEDTDYVPAEEFNDLFVPVRTMQEQESHPYPENVLTACYAPDDLEPESDDDDPWHEWQYQPNLYDLTSDAFRCDVLERHSEFRIWDSSEPPHERYDVRIFRDGTERLVFNIPRRAIEFFDYEYTSDLFLRDAFRHEIGIPDHLFPAAWKDKHA